MRKTRLLVIDTRLHANQLQKYRLRAQTVHIIESFPVPVILNYGQSDHFFFVVLTELTRQIQYPLAVPIVSTSSRDYYWAQPEFNLLGVPLLEEHSLLGLPDLLHELAHLLLRTYDKEFLNSFRRYLKRFFLSERQRIRREQKPPEYEAILHHIQRQWHDEWVIEFACDMIATYLVGPAYGWAHLRLCSKMSDNVFRPGPDDALAAHPADDARLIGIIAVLQTLGLDTEVQAIKQAWGSYTKLTGARRPRDYALCYPLVLLQHLAEDVTVQCRTLGLKAFTDHHPAGDGNIPNLLNEAWSIFHATPEQFPAWEEHALDELRRRLALPNTLAPIS